MSSQDSINQSAGTVDGLTSNSNAPVAVSNPTPPLRRYQPPHIRDPSTAVPTPYIAPFAPHRSVVNDAHRSVTEIKNKQQTEIYTLRGLESLLIWATADAKEKTELEEQRRQDVNIRKNDLLGRLENERAAYHHDFIRLKEKTEEKKEKLEELGIDWEPVIKEILARKAEKEQREVI